MLKNSITIGRRIAWEIRYIGLFRIYPPIYIGESILGCQIRDDRANATSDLRTITRMFVMDPPGKSMVLFTSGPQKGRGGS